MILGDVFERFAAACPSPVMARATLENALNPRIIDQLFLEVADKQYTREILFSAVVDLIGLVVCRIRPAIHAAYQARAETIDASLKAVYDKLDRTEPAVATAPVRATADRLGPVIKAMGGARPELPPGYRVKILHGDHSAGTEHRIKELRTIRAGALPGHSLVVLDPALMSAVEVIPCEDGHSQERSLLGGGSGDAPGPRPVDPGPQLLHDRVPVRDRPPRGRLRRPPARLDAARGVRRQAAVVRPGRHPQGLRTSRAVDRP